MKEMVQYQYETLRMHLRYLGYILRHKWFVLLACWKDGLYLQGITHDWHKFLPSEFFPYANYFYGNGHTITTRRDKTVCWKPGETSDKEFNYAWYQHVKRSRHHWQGYSYPADLSTRRKYTRYQIYTLPIPEKYLREMLCDWEGAGKAQGVKTGVRPWWQANNHKMILHPESRKWLEDRLA